MTRDEWLASDDYWAMLQNLRGRMSDRKLRLFAVGCCRQVWDSIETVRCRRAVETAERFADGSATLGEVLEVRRLALGSVLNSQRRKARSDPWGGYDPRLEIAAETAQAAPYSALYDGLARMRLDFELRTLAPGLLRCVFGRDRGRFPPFEPDWRTPTVEFLSQAIYEERAFDGMPILGDALEESGCCEEGMLGHCREGGRHVRGCWVVDLILGKT